MSRTQSSFIQRSLPAVALLLILVPMAFANVGYPGGRLAGHPPATGIVPAATPSTITPTPPPEIITPVPLGRWVAWPERPTDALPLEDIELRDVYFPSPDEGWAVGFGSNRGWYDVAIILHYRDGEWVVDESLPWQEREEMRLYAIDGTGPEDIWAVGKDRRRLIYRDGDVAALLHYDGERWTKLDIAPLGRAAWVVLNDIDMVAGASGVEGWAISQRNPAGWGGFVLHYVDGAWEMQMEINGQDLMTIDMVDTTDGWIVARNEDNIAYYHWYHNGQWQNRSSWGAQMFGVSMADAEYGWAVGPSGSADEYLGTCHNPQPGRPCHWHQYTVTGPEGRALGIDLYDIQLLSRYDGWLVGTHRQIASSVLHYERLSQDVTSRSNINWHLMEIENDPVKNLYGLFMLPGPDGWAVDGWAVGEDGAILHYEGPTMPAAEPPTFTPTTTATPTSTVTLTPSPTTTPTAMPTVTPSATLTPASTSTATPTLQPPLKRYRYLPLLIRNRSSSATRTGMQPARA